MQLIKYTILIILLIGFSSCGIYRQNVVNAPLLQQKGQTQVSGHLSFNGLEGQGAYALTNHIGLLAGYQHMGASTRDNFINRHTFKEIGAGLYKKTAAGNIKELFILAGKGFTSRTAVDRDSTGKQLYRKADYTRFVVQGDFGNKNNKLEYIVSPRLLAVQYYNVTDNMRLDYQNLPKFHIYAEGAFTLRYPILSFLMISGQACASLPVIGSGQGYNDYYEFSPFNFSMGLLFNFNLLKPSNQIK